MVSDAERKVAGALRARGRYVSGDAGAVLRELADPTPAMIEAPAERIAEFMGEGGWQEYASLASEVIDAWLRAETRESMPQPTTRGIVPKLSGQEERP